jgi:anti-sigma factor ChrR (cupin superfamily)
MTSTQYCFCELAPLYVLGMLNESERDWVDRQIIETPELAEELSQYEVAVTALTYDVAPVEIAEDLKDQLFQNLGLALPEKLSAASERQQENPFLSIRFQDIKWQKHSVPGVEICIFYTDSLSKRVSGALKAAPGMHYPLHQHAGVEEIYMLSGDLRIGSEVYGAGDYIRSQPGSAHAPKSHNGCMFFFNTSMDDDYCKHRITESLS